MYECRPPARLAERCYRGQETAPTDKEMIIMDQYDVIIVGGGLVGLSLAATLGKNNITVAVLEANTPQRNWDEGSIDQRVFAINRFSQQLFEDVVAWGQMQSRALAYTDMHVWDSEGDGEIHFDCAEIGEQALGHIIESRVIEQALLGCLTDIPSVTYLSQTSVTAFEMKNEVQQIELRNGSKLHAPVIVGADGQQSSVRESAGIHAIASDYGQQAIVCTVGTELSHRATAWQRFLPTGPLAFLPLFDGRCSIVWSADTDEAQRLMVLTEEQFCEELSLKTDHRLGEVISTTERALFPLKKQYAQQYVAPRLALVGDAAHVIHPLAGQGVNLGIEDASVLCDVITDAIKQQRDPGSMQVLRRYERSRKGDVMTMMTAMDGFKHLFGSSIPALRWLRNTGLNVVDAMQPVKNQIMRTAMRL